MTLQETIDQLIEYIDVATAVASVSNHQVATVLDFLNESLKTLSSSLTNLDSRYLRKDIADSAGAAESFPHGISVSQILGIGDNPSFSGTSSKAVNDGDGNNIADTYAKKSDFFDFGNVGFGYLINAVIGKTAYLADDEASGGAVEITFMETEQEYTDTLLFTDLETEDLLWNLLEALEASDQWDYIKEKYGILEYGILNDSSDVHDGQLYFRSNNNNFDIDSSLPSDLESIDGQEFSVDGTESHWIEKRRNTGVVYIELNDNKIYRYSESDNLFGAYISIGGSEIAVDCSLGNTNNPVANSVINAAITSLQSSLSGKESLSNKTTSISASSDNDQYPSAKAVWTLVQSVSALIASLSAQVSQNQNAINGLDNTSASIAGRVTAVEGKVNSSYVSGKTVMINGDSVNVADVVLGYYIDGYKDVVSLELPSMSSSLSFPFNIGVNHVEASGTGIGLIEDIAQKLSALGFSVTYQQVYTNIFQIVVMSTQTIGVIQPTGASAGIVFRYSQQGNQQGFYSDSSYIHLITGSTDRIYIDVDTNMVYRYVSGTTYLPLSSQPFSSGGYDATTQEIVMNYAGGSLRIPVGDMLPEFTAGQGIQIEGGLISQDYLVVTEEQMEDYLASGLDDGRIRYVYDE